MQLTRVSCSCLLLTLLFAAPRASAQETDQTQTPNAAGAGIAKSLEQELGTGRGDIWDPQSSLYLIARDPFRAIARGRALFQRKFTRAQGLGPRFEDGSGDIVRHAALGAGLADSCAACHGRPQGAAGSGGDVFTRPASRDAPHLFGLGLVEMLADEMSADLRRTRARALELAAARGSPVSAPLESKGIAFGTLVAHPDGRVDTSGVEGVDTDLRVRPFFAEGRLFSIREFVVGALAAEMGLQSFDRDLAAAASGERVVTPAGLVLDGSLDSIGGPPVPRPDADADGDGVSDEASLALVDYLEFYLLNYFRPAVGRTSAASARGEELFHAIGCADCHVPDLVIEVDRRVADVATHYDDARGNPFNRLFAKAVVTCGSVDDGSGHPPIRPPKADAFLVRGIFSDLKRHDLGSAFWELGFDGSVTRAFVTEPLWGVASTGPWGHDGRSTTLRDAILRHGGEALRPREAFEALGDLGQEDVVDFLSTLVLFPPPATASNLDPGDRNHPDYPLVAHGKIDLSVLFNDPGDKE